MVSFSHTLGPLFCISSSNLRALRRRRAVEITCSLFLWSRFPRKANVPILYWEVRHREAKGRERGELHREEGRANMKGCLTELATAL